MIMKNKKYLAVWFLLFLVLANTSVFGQSSVRPRELAEALSGGNVTLTASGNGSSSGAAIDGTLKNNTSAEIFINVILGGGLFLRNSGSGQNMVATQVFLSDGGYMLSGAVKYIRLPSNAAVHIMLIAFCADFERDNPGPDETFTLASMPGDIRTIASKISKFMADHFDDDDDDVTIPVQLALWRSRGESRSHIAEKFDFDDGDWRLAEAIGNY